MEKVKEIINKLDIHDLYFQAQESRLMKLEKLLLDGGHEIEEGKIENEINVWKEVIDNEKAKMNLNLNEYEQCVINHCGYLTRKDSGMIEEHQKAFHKNVMGDTTTEKTRTAFMDPSTFDQIMEQWLADLRGKRPKPGSNKQITPKKKQRQH